MFNSFIKVLSNKKLRNGIIFTVIIIILCRIAAEIVID